MAYAPSRSMNGELKLGSVEGSYKTVNSRERGGFVEPTTQEAREDLHDLYYGIHESPSKELPTGGDAYTPGFVPTKPVNQFG